MGLCSVGVEGRETDLTPQYNKEQWEIIAKVQGGGLVDGWLLRGKYHGKEGCWLNVPNRILAGGIPGWLAIAWEKVQDEEPNQILRVGILAKPT